MKYMKKTIIISLIAGLVSCTSGYENSWIRINQLGYMPGSPKNAVMVSKEKVDVSEFSLCRAVDDQEVFRSEAVREFDEWGAFQKGFRLDFTQFTNEGEYYIKVKNVKSPVFRIDNDVYANTSDFILNYMRQQRCGYNTFYNSTCHQNDGFIIFHPDEEKDSTHIDVRGGWHDASDYLQYVTTSANAVYQMLFAYRENPSVFGDEFDAMGNSESNGIPDILDEAKWGLDWLDRMNPSYGEMYNQLADDRDHIGYKLPANDTADYGRGGGGERPVYFCTGEPQGSERYKNRATGIASTAGKYASAFALGSMLLEDFYPDFSAKIKAKATDAYKWGKLNPGVCQTAPHMAPYFYEEDNWVDDMELAAAQVFELTQSEDYLDEAIEYGIQEPVTPWMGADTARHYQWYPFLNLGHSLLAFKYENNAQNSFSEYFEEGIKRVHEKGAKNPFFIGIPFIWCSNNLVTAMATQCHIYRTATGDESYYEMEQSLIDWLFGCNPWGTSMIVGLPGNGDYPSDVHSAAVTLMGKQPVGGLVDGPIYGSIFGRLKGVHLSRGDVYEQFQSRLVVYHDDNADYSTNEPTMDGTASLSYILSSLEREGLEAENN
jgi:hypothetical protein